MDKFVEELIRELSLVLDDTYSLVRMDMELFNSYARGGVEYLYEKLVLNTPDIDDDYTDFRISNIVSLITNPLEVEEI